MILKHLTSWSKGLFVRVLLLAIGTAPVLAQLRPGLNLDPLSGEPRLSMDIRGEREASRSLDGLFQIVASKKRRISHSCSRVDQYPPYFSTTS